MTNPNTPRRNSQTCTSDLLTWPELAPPDSAYAPPTAHRSHQPSNHSDQMSDVLRRDQLPEELPPPDSASAPTQAHRSHQPSNQSNQMTDVLRRDQLTEELPPPDSASAPTFAYRSHQPSNHSNQMSDVLRRDQPSQEEAQSLTNRKPCSGYKMKDITGSGIFSDGAEDTAPEADSANFKNKASIRINQQAMNYGVSQISFNTEESVSPKKPASLPEVAKQRELSGTLHSEPDAKSQKQTTSAKTKELSGSDIFGPPPEIKPRSVAAAGFSDSRDRIDVGEYLPRNVHTSVRVSNPSGGQSSIVFGDEPAMNTSKKVHDQKFAELTGNNIFKDDVPPGTVEKLRSSAKLREMAGSDIFGDGKAENRGNILGGRRHHSGGSDIFADGQAENRDKILGARKPPGGGSTISLT